MRGDLAATRRARHGGGEHHEIDVSDGRLLSSVVIIPHFAGFVKMDISQFFRPFFGEKREIVKTGKNFENHLTNDGEHAIISP